MTMFRSRSPVKSVMLSMFAVALATCTLLGSSQQANAGSIIEFSLDGTTWLPANQFFSAGNSVSTGSVTIGGFSVNASLLGNSPGGPVAELLTSTLQIKNNNAGTASIWIAFGNDGFTSPTSPPGVIKMDSHIGGSIVLDNAANKMTFQSFLDLKNGLGHLGQPGTYSTAEQKPGVTVGSYSHDEFAFVNPVGGTYSVSQGFKITLGAGSSLNHSANTTLQNVPEPATMTLFGVGLVGMAGYGWRKRRQQLTQTVA